MVSCNYLPAFSLCFVLQNYPDGDRARIKKFHLLIHKYDYKIVSAKEKSWRKFILENSLSVLRHLENDKYV